MELTSVGQEFPFKLWQRVESSPQTFPVTVTKPQLLEHLKDGSVKPCDCVVVAAGVGSRMRADVPKQYLDLAGHTLLEWTLFQLFQTPLISRIVLVLSSEDRWFDKSIFANYPKVASRLVITDGGKERVDSVFNGLKAVESEWCMVHDCARPFVHISDIESLCYATQCVSGSSAEIAPNKVRGAILAIPETDTLKRIQYQPLKVDAADAIQESFPLILNTEDRSQIYRAQTPQMFKTEHLLNSLLTLREQGKTITDEASILDYVENDTALLVKGSPFNFKITTPDDLIIALALVKHFQ